VSGFFYGVIEGFYGRQWSWQTRKDYASFLLDHNFDCYIYAPKGDQFLRGQWQLPWPDDEYSKLAELAAVYRRAGLRFGVGLSPLGLFSDYSPDSRHALRAKVEQINDLGADILCILFDDMPGDFPGLAARQLDIVNDVVAVSRAGQHIVCPTYYSFDPVLEKVFGPMPDNYLYDLGRGLPEDTGLFWTGNQVISTAYSRQDIDEVATLIGRQPILWDNYPVNDGRLTSSHLHLQPYSGRPATLSKWVQGHCVNPMNQPELSKLVLMTLAELYTQGVDFDCDQALQHALATIRPAELGDMLAADIDTFQLIGRKDLDPRLLGEYIKRYSAYDHDVAKEVVDWLQGGYEFDPACLTE
jgi:hyaluronoglucosaminidase